VKTKPSLLLLECAGTQLFTSTIRIVNSVLEERRAMLKMREINETNDAAPTAAYFADECK
jgi:hypothetical protein